MDQVEDFDGIYYSAHKECIDIERMLENMRKMQQKKAYTDLIIEVGKERIACHKLVLFTACPALEASMAEKNSLGRLVLEGLDPHVVMDVVDVLYGHQVDFQVEVLYDVLEACKMLHVDTLEKEINSFLSTTDVLEYTLGMWQKSRKSGCDKLRKDAIRMMSARMGILCTTDKFLQLSIEELLSILINEDLEVDCADDLLLACLAWVHYNLPSRKQHVLRIMNNMHLDKCNIDVLNAFRNLHPDVMRLNEAETIGVLSELSSQSLVLLGGIKEQYEPSNVCMVSRQLLAPFVMEPLLTIPDDVQSHWSPIVCVPDGFIILLGGPKMLSTTKYNAVSKTWHPLPNSPLDQNLASAVACNNSVYLLGGKGPRDTVYRLDLSSLEWSEELNMLDKQVWPITAAWGNTIYVMFNDYKKSEKAPMLQEYDTLRKAPCWRYRSSLPEDAPGTCGASLVTTDDEDFLYLVGGWYRIAARYRISSDAWSLIQAPPIQNNPMGSSARAMYFEGKIYLIGDTHTHPYMSVLDLQTEEWSDKVCLPVDRCSCFTASIVPWV